MSKKISLIGAGQIGGTLAHLIGLKELTDEGIKSMRSLLINRYNYMRSYVIICNYIQLYVILCVYIIVCNYMQSYVIICNYI